MEGDSRDAAVPAEAPADDEPDRGRFGQFQNLIDRTRKHNAYTLVGYVVRRFSRDSCPSVASSLSYTSLLAMVPMMAIGLAFLRRFRRSAICVTSCCGR